MSTSHRPAPADSLLKGFFELPLSRFDWVTAPPTTRDEWRDAEEIVPVHAWPLTADIVGSYVRSHTVPPQDVPDVVRSVLTALMNLEFPAPDAAGEPNDAMPARNGGKRGRMRQDKGNQGHKATSSRRLQRAHAAE